MTDQHIDKKPKVEEGDQKPDTLMVALVPSASNLLQGAPPATPISVPPPKYNWHLFYNDPNLDLVLKSSDNVYFRASKHVLGRCSVAFKPDRIVEPGNPIVLPYASDAISLFLSQMSQPKPPEPTHSSFDAAYQYLALIKRIAPIHDVLLVRAGSAYQTTNARWPLDYLVHIANTTENMAEAARWALEDVDENNNEQWNIIKQPAELVEQMERLPEYWREALWKSLMRVERDWDSGEVTTVLRWPSKRIAKRLQI